MTTYTSKSVDELRDELPKRIGLDVPIRIANEFYDAYTAFATLLRAMEKAKPVAWLQWIKQPDDTVKLYTSGQWDCNAFPVFDHPHTDSAEAISNIIAEWRVLARVNGNKFSRDAFNHCADALAAMSADPLVEPV